MPPIEDLPADQQAVLRLLLGQGRSYDQIARSLRMAPAAVRDRAHEAVRALGPAGAPLGDERRAQVTDYLLGQQDEDDAQATREVLAGSAAARGWARTVSAELRPLAEEDLPDVPDVAGTGEAAPAEPDAAPARARDDLLGGEDRGRRLRPGALLLTGLAVLAALVGAFFLGRATGGDDGGGTSAARTTAANANIVGQANLRPPQGSPSPRALGVAQFTERDGQRLINVLAEGLPRAPRGAGFGVWLAGKGQKPVWLGYFQAVTTTGQVGAQARLEVDPRRYGTVLITRERGQNPTTPSRTYLSGNVTFAKDDG